MASKIDVKLATTLVLASLLPFEAWAGEMPRIYRSGYFTGRGDTGIATAENHEAIFYNPAGIATGTGIYKETVIASPMVEISQDTKNLAREVLIQDSQDSATLRKHLGQPQHSGVYNFTGVVLRRAALGAITSGSTDILIAKSKKEAGLEVAEGNVAATQGVTFTLAESFWDGSLLVGSTMKYLVRGEGAISVSVAESDKVKGLKQSDLIGYGTGFGADLGLMLRGGGRLDPSFGLTVGDIGDTKISPRDESKPISALQQTINAGVAVSPGTKLSKFRFLADVHDIAGEVTKNTFKKLHLGAEITFVGIVGVTGGLNQGYPCGGAYLDFKFLRLDAGAYTEEVGDRAGARPDKRFFAGLTAGF